MLPEYCGAVDCFPVVANDGASLAFLLVSMYSMYVCLHTPMSVYMEQPCLPAKYLLAVLLVTLHLSFLVVKYLGGQAVTPAEMFGTTTRCVAYLFYAAILTEHPYRDLPMLRAAFFAMAILGFWQCQQLLQEHPPDEAWKLGLHGGAIFLSGLALLPATLLQPSESPFDKANWFSRLTFAYVAPLMGVASFDPADIPALPVADATPTASRRFVSAYEMEKTTSPSLLRLLWRLHGRDIGGFFLWSIGNTVLNMMTPLLTKSLLEWSSRPAPSPSHGYLLASALVLQALLRTVSRSQYSLSKDRFNIRCTSGLQAGIYARVLSLGPRDGDCIGHVTNYVTMDVPVIVRLPGSLFDVALLPMQIAMALVVLGDEVSFAFLGGLVLLGAMLPLQVYLAHLVQRVKARLLAIRDDRLRLSVSTLVGIRTLKSFGWTRYFSDQLEHVRALELQALRLRQIITAFCDVLSSAAPLLIQTGVFVVIVYTGQPITAARAYTIISLLQQLVGPITDLPWIARSLGEAYVSFTRLSQFLFAPSALATDDDPRPSSWRNCTFGWTPETRTDELTAPLLCNGPFRLHLSELTLTPGANVVVCGRSGAGKSSLLLALLGDMPCVHGAAVRVADSIAYAPQTPWLVPGSLEYNVTLESEYEPNLYARVMALCRLDALPRTLRVSEEGANLSGGQRARVGLARALYQRAAVYLLDDCWSGLDTCTARAILAELRTVLPPSSALVLSTHALILVRGLAPTLLVLDDGAIVERGAYDVLRATPGSRLEALVANDAMPEEEVTGMPAPSTPLCERGGVESGANRVWHTYAAAMGYRTAVAWPLTNVSLQLLQNGMDYWTAQYTTYHATSPDAFARGLIALTIGTLCMTTAHIGLVVHGSLRAAKTLYNRMTHQLLRTSLGFYETTPIGRILNRLGDDTSTVDTMIPMALDFLVLEVISITGSLVVLYFTNVYVLLLLLPLSAVYLYLQARYRPPARDLSRLNHVVQSPLMMHLKATLNGLSVLRGRGSAAAWQTQFEAHLCLFQRVSLAQSLTLGWLAIRLDALGIVVAGFVGFSAAMAAARGHPMPSAYLGLTLMYALPIIRKLKLGLEAFVWAEQAMVSVERLREYGALPDEAGGREEKDGDDVDWVTGGAIELMQVSLPRGRLTNVSVSIRALEKVGICGPSGAGKSSLLNCFFRAVDYSGRILIDGQDVAALSLQQLRAALAYVPQTTMLFATSVRKNLDPLDQYDDDRIWAALHACGLRSLVLGFPLQLEQFIDGSVLSQGQTQLLGIGRAVLKAAKIVCIDEATASVDHETDRRLRELMAEAFSGATVLTVAHRFAAIAASDRVLVLEHGRVVAFDSPTSLLQDAHGYFATMA
ncbi:hypothetical protein SPRG_00898 [Saprolegnia parasitica CBS 223.65]|uniref:Uncharacterized protein n=1 Tax=Saprolegnia parasitica (strain CBS 223.65) TaxID=695850 RepID=A0A067D757_SAPPC|nr:hypothetical protein SPRG_00898 [Saprolegnia parasitica CBS 223.65]KDO34837.1 hypothetical protein SPRG_00898 [Saprolegnia parasitica CBS 223.65]|eukprot:XP_012194500.1 hypothetical protein SPRG_00898 [Saprolegnia parasitica CBS 223.65]